MEDDSKNITSEDMQPPERKMLKLRKNKVKSPVGMSVSDTYLNGYKNPDDYIHFHVGQTKELFIERRFILAQSSPVFKAMLYGELKTTGSVEVLDVHSEAFKTMLEFVNGKEVSFLNSDHAARVCYAADKYDLPELKQVCAEYLFPMNIDEMWIALGCGMLFDIELLTNAALKILRENPVDVLSSTQFMQLSEKILSEIVKDDYFFVNNEVKILQAVIYWAKHQCDTAEKPRTHSNLREVLGNVVQNIRFLNMNKMDILTVGKEILTEEEIEQVLKCLSKEIEPSDLNFLCRNSEKRKHIVNCEAYSNELVYNINFASSTKYTLALSDNMQCQMLKLRGVISLVSVTVLCRFQSDELDEKYYFEKLIVELKQDGSVIASGTYIGKAPYNGSIKISFKSRPDLYKRKYEIAIRSDNKKSAYYQMKWCDFSKWALFHEMGNGYSHIIGLEYFDI